MVSNWLRGKTKHSYGMLQNESAMLVEESWEKTLRNGGRDAENIDFYQDFTLDEGLSWHSRRQYCTSFRSNCLLNSILRSIRNVFVIL